VYRAVRDAGGTVDPDELAAVAPDRDPRVLVGMLEQAGLLRRGLDRGRRMQIDLLTAPDDAATRVERLLERARLVAEARADRVVAFAEVRSCRHAQVAEHFGERLDGPCGACDVCDPRHASERETAAAPPLPEDVGAAIVDAVRSLRWPLGRRSLVATLRGSLKAPPSARRSTAFRLLAAATDADVRRWVKSLEDAGALREELTPDGYRVLVVDPAVRAPEIRTGGPIAVDAGLVERLRAWRLERSHEDGFPAYVVLHDATLHELAAARPRTEGELANVKGLGPVKVDRYGGDLLALIAAG
jgi:ATP-dependent DNA helicase RecQ